MWQRFYKFIIMRQKAILIFDIGKTNKKYFLFTEDLQELQSAYLQLPEITDDDGFACDNLDAITEWVLDVYKKINDSNQYEITAVNFSTYGASLVHLDKDKKPVTPLYNYLKQIPADVLASFEASYGDLDSWSQQTASPFLGMLNAGLQLYWLKHAKPEVFKEIKYSVFLPQYISYLFTGQLVTEFTGIGCHTGMWNYAANDYHEWMYKEGLTNLLPPLTSTYTVFQTSAGAVKFGTGIHDSSAALITYLHKYPGPFMLLSTGTWSICFNPFNRNLLTIAELHEDCLCYMQPDGKQVKASRLFMGNEYNKWLSILNRYFNVANDYHKNIQYNESLFANSITADSRLFTAGLENKTQAAPDSAFVLKHFSNYEEAYHHLIKELLVLQIKKIALVNNPEETKQVYVDGGFAGNNVFITMLRQMMPGVTITPSENPLGSALGAAKVVLSGVTTPLQTIMN